MSEENTLTDDIEISGEQVDKWWTTHLFHPKSVDGSFVVMKDKEEVELVKAQLKYIRDFYSFLKEQNFPVTGITILGSTLKGYAGIETLGTVYGDDSVVERQNISDIDISVSVKGSYEYLEQNISKFLELIEAFGKENGQFKLQVVNMFSSEEYENLFAVTEKMKYPQEVSFIAVYSLLFPGVGENPKIGELRKYRSKIAEDLSKKTEKEREEWIQGLINFTYEKFTLPISLEKTLEREMVKDQTELEEYSQNLRLLIERRVRLLFNV